MIAYLLGEFKTVADIRSILPKLHVVDNKDLAKAFGAGSGMAGLPGDYSSPSRFVRAYFYTHASIPLENADTAVNQASRILDNFNYPKGVVREGASPENYKLNFTTWTVIADIKNKHYYWWTEFNRQMRMVDLSKLKFNGNKIIATPLDKMRVQNVDDRTGNLLQ